MRGWLIPLLLAAALPAAAQTVEPDPIGPVKAIGVRRFEAGFVYGFAVFTNSQSGTEWTAAAPQGSELDLDTSPSVGLGFAWSAGENLRLGLRAAHQATRLLASDADTTSRTDLTLLHLLLEVERTFGQAACVPWSPWPGAVAGPTRAGRWPGTIRPLPRSASTSPSTGGWSCGPWRGCP